MMMTMVACVCVNARWGRAVCVVLCPYPEEGNIKTSLAVIRDKRASLLAGGGWVVHSLVRSFVRSFVRALDFRGALHTRVSPQHGAVHTWRFILRSHVGGCGMTWTE